MRVCLAVAALGVAVWMGVLAHTSEAARPAAHNLGALQGVNFVGSCTFSHMAMDDPIVYPRQPGASHDHSFVGNTTTNAFSTLRTLRAGSSTCKRAGETAAYWMPTLLLDGQMVPPAAATIYYRRKTLAPLRAFPAGFKMIAGNRAASSPQGMQITYWNCGAASSVPASTEVPACPDTRGQSLRLHVNFPSCWDGKHLDSANHHSHMAYSAKGVCPKGYPVAVPQIMLIIQYPISNEAPLQLASFGQISGHADFFNGWSPPELKRLVDYCLNALRACGAVS